MTRHYLHSRRELLRIAAGSTIAAGIAAQGWQPAALAAQESDLSFDFSGSGIEIPGDDVTFRTLTSGPGPKGVFLQEMFDAYHGVHANVKVEYDQMGWNDIAQIVPLGVRNGNAHDVFQIPNNVPASQAVNEGWVAALDDLIPDIETWKAGFPEGSFLNGFSDFNGKTYTFPVSSNKRYGTLCLYNRDYMTQAGFDPETTPLTWDQFREAARKITEQGDGEYYGLILEGNQPDRFGEWVRNLARMAGAMSGPMDIDWRTGKYIYTDDQYVAATELLLAINDDGSVFPGSLALNANEARAQTAQGVVGMILQGPWNIPTWQASNPEFDFGVASQPVPNSGDPVPLTVGPGGSNAFWIYAKSPNQQVAADIFHYLGTAEGQTNWAKRVGIADAATFPEAMAAANLDERSQKAADLFTEQIRQGPDPRVKNPEAEAIFAEMKALTPNFGATIQGLFAGAITDVKAALQDLQDRSDAELDRAIVAAQAKGANVSRDDFVFPNWDPAVDYTAEMYDAL